MEFIQMGIKRFKSNRVFSFAICMVIANSFALSLAVANEVELISAAGTHQKNTCTSILSLNDFKSKISGLYSSKILEGRGAIYYASLHDLLKEGVVESSPPMLNALLDLLRDAPQDKDLDPVFKSAINYLINNVDLRLVTIAVTGDGLKLKGLTMGLVNFPLAQPGHMFYGKDWTTEDLTKSALIAHKASELGAVIRPAEILMLGDLRTLPEVLRNPEFVMLFYLHEILHYVDIHRYLSAIKTGAGLPDYLMPMRYSDQVSLSNYTAFEIILETRAHLAVIREGRRKGLVNDAMAETLANNLFANLARITEGVDDSINPLRQLGILQDASQENDSEPRYMFNVRRLNELEKELRGIF